MKRHIFTLILSVFLCAAVTLYTTGCFSNSNSKTDNVSIDTSQLTDKDTQTNYDASSAILITLSDDSISCSSTEVSIDGSCAVIKTGGTYVIEGSLTDGQIIVDADKTQDVHLIMSGADITCSYSAPIYIKSADKTIITLEEGSQNFLADGSDYKYTDASAEEPNATLFSKDTLTINGSGCLTVNACFNNGIQTKDNLKIVGGNITVTAVNDALKGKGSVIVTDGTLTLKSGGDGIHSNGDITINGGSLILSSDDDGIHSDSSLTVNSGIISVTHCYEGLESGGIIINGGEISIISQDDGINVASGNDASGWGGMKGRDAFASDSSCMLTINGGSVYIECEGDGLDSNGTIEMTGGYIVVNGPSSSGNGSLDYGISFTVTGGYLVAAGAQRMAENISDSSSQCGALLNLTESYAGRTVTITDSENNIIASFNSSKNWNSILISTPELTVNNTYNIYVDGEISGADLIGTGCYIGGTLTGGTDIGSFTQSSTIYGSGMGMGGPGGMGGHGGGMGGPR